jgi:hypothetical protein
VWKEIAASRPPDFFTRGSWPLLEQYCEMAVLQEGYLAMLRDDPLNPELQAVTIKMAAALNATATKLRLAITSVDKRSGMLTEKEPAPGPSDDTLFGGNVVRFWRDARVGATLRAGPGRVASAPAPALADAIDQAEARRFGLRLVDQPQSKLAPRIIMATDQVANTTTEIATAMATAVRSAGAPPSPVAG